MRKSTQLQNKGTLHYVDIYTDVDIDINATSNVRIFLLRLVFAFRFTVMVRLFSFAGAWANGGTAVFHRGCCARSL